MFTAHSYSRLPVSSPIPWQKPASWSPKESLLRWRTVAILTLATQAALYLWLNSPLRYRELTVSAVACRKPAWWLFPAIPSDNLAPTFEESELYLPISTSASLQDNSSAAIKHRPAKISLLQSCTYPDVSNSYLRALLDNHREYCSHNNMEYLFRTGKGDVWKKIAFLAQKLETELSKPEKERIEWIFLADMDTVFPSNEVHLSAILPPKDIVQPFILASNDWHGFNAGVLFFRVDARSLEIARTVLSFSRTDRRLKYAEQDALRITYEQQKLVESGEVVMMPNEWFNSLDGQSAFLNDSAASVMVHYPSKKFKRSDFLPLLRKMVSHSGPSLTEVQARHRNRLLTTATSAFWDEYRRSF